VKKTFQKRLARRKKLRPIRALQIEVTSRCSRRCRVCPRSILSHKWREGDLNEEIFQTLERDLHKAEHVHLQGWGEPLLHPKIFDWAERARNEGCSVGITTNGDDLENAFPWLLKGIITHLTVSLAGRDRMNERLRGGANSERIFHSVRRLSELSKKNKAKIKIQICYLLTRENHDELKDVVRKASSIGADEVYVIHLDFCSSAVVQEMATFDQDSLHEGVEESLTAAREAARQEGIYFRGPPVHGENVLVCALDPVHFAYVSWEGKVGPCVNLLLPVKGNIPRCSPHGEIHIKPVVFGKINPMTLQDILTSKTRQEFILPFRKRLGAEKRFLSSLELEPGYRFIEKLESADKEREKTLEDFPFPESCRECPKARGW